MCRLPCSTEHVHGERWRLLLDQLLSGLEFKKIAFVAMSWRHFENSFGRHRIDQPTLKGVRVIDLGILQLEYSRRSFCGNPKSQKLIRGIRIRTSQTDQYASTIGLVLCQTKDRVLPQYSLRDINKPIGVADYELTRVLPTSLASSLPSIEDIEAELTHSMLDDQSQTNDEPASVLVNKIVLEKAALVREKKIRTSNSHTSRNAFLLRTMTFCRQ